MSAYLRMATGGSRDGERRRLDSWTRARRESRRHRRARSLAQLYQYDFSEFDPRRRRSTDARFDGWSNWTDFFARRGATTSSSSASTVRSPGSLARLLGSRRSAIAPERVWWMDEFFVMREVPRDAASGSASPRLIFDRFPGAWEVAQIDIEHRRAGVLARRDRPIHERGLRRVRARRRALARTVQYFTGPGRESCSFSSTASTIRRPSAMRSRRISSGGRRSSARCSAAGRRRSTSTAGRGVRGPASMRRRRPRRSRSRDAIASFEPDAILDLTDEPVLPPAERFRLASVALASRRDVSRRRLRPAATDLRERPHEAVDPRVRDGQADGQDGRRERARAARGRARPIDPSSWRSAGAVRTRRA